MKLKERYQNSIIYVSIYNLSVFKRTCRLYLSAPFSKLFLIELLFLSFSLFDGWNAEKRYTKNGNVHLDVLTLGKSNPYFVYFIWVYKGSSPISLPINIKPISAN